MHPLEDMQKRIALEELNKNLAAAKSNVDAWASVKIRKADDLKATQKSTVEADRGMITCRYSAMFAILLCEERALACCQGQS